MLMIFRRTILPSSEVTVLVDGILDGQVKKIGQLSFPSSKSWSKFWGAIQRGALNIQDLEVKLENLSLQEIKNATIK